MSGLHPQRKALGSASRQTRFAKPPGPVPWATPGETGLLLDRDGGLGFDGRAGAETKVNGARVDVRVRYRAAFSERLAGFSEHE
jgi:hypothetical protein